MERAASSTTSCQPHIIRPQTKTTRTKKLEKRLRESLNSLTATPGNTESCLHILLIKIFLVKQSHCLSLPDGGIAHPKPSHLLSQWVIWAQGVWDVAVCLGRGKLCENCVGEAKKNITAWQQWCREWRMRRRSGGSKGSLGGRRGGEEGMGMTKG